MQYDKTRLIVGSFVTLMFIALVAFFYFFIKEKGLLDAQYRYYFSVNSAESLSVGMPLKFSGFAMGRVDAISLKDDGSVEIVVLVNEENRKWMREDTLLTIKKPLIGAPYIVVDSKLQKPLLEPNSTLKITRSDDINDIVAKMEPVVDKLITIINNIDTITSYLSKDESELMSILRNFDAFGKKLVKEPLFTTMTADENATKNMINIINELNTNMKDITIIIHEISKISSSLNEDIIEPSSHSIKSLNEIMEDIKRKLEVINGTVNAVGSYDKDLAEVKEQVLTAIEKSNEIIEKVDVIIEDEKSSEVILP
jgi:phospholipid/cholesterol/gamma-HCH transport system substrate-binding protein